MKKLRFYLMAAVATCALMSSCSASYPICATSVPVGTKMGVSSQQYFCLFAVSEGGTIQEAAQSAGITKISHVEVKTQPFYPLIGKKKTIVYGE